MSICPTHQVTYGGSPVITRHTQPSTIIKIHSIMAILKPAITRKQVKYNTFEAQFLPTFILVAKSQISMS